ncbi:hypothetical protein ABH930_004609 [Kitasatospora sp. GAS204A]|nr:hypothetical protein [Kitasatospora sp. GAS204B]
MAFDIPLQRGETAPQDAVRVLLRRRCMQAAVNGGYRT